MRQKRHPHILVDEFDVENKDEVMDVFYQALFGNK
jgi:hypothetical protein